MQLRHAEIKEVEGYLLGKILEKNEYFFGYDMEETVVEMDPVDDLIVMGDVMGWRGD